MNLNYFPYQSCVFEDWSLLVVSKNINEKMLIDAGSYGNASIDDAHWETEVVLRVDDRKKNVKITHGFVGMIMILNLF